MGRDLPARVAIPSDSRESRPFPRASRSKLKPSLATPYGKGDVPKSMAGGSSWSWTGGKARRRRSEKGVLCRMNWTLSRLYSFLGSKMFTCKTGAEIEQRKQRSESGRNPTKNSSRRLGVEVRARGRIAGEIGASEQCCKTQNEDGCLTKRYLVGYSNIETGGRPTVANRKLRHVSCD